MLPQTFIINLQLYLLFSDSKTMATLLNYTSKSFIKLTPATKLMEADLSVHNSHAVNIEFSSISHDDIG